MMLMASRNCWRRIFSFKRLVPAFFGCLIDPHPTFITTLLQFKLLVVLLLFFHCVLLILNCIVLCTVCLLDFFFTCSHCMTCSPSNSELQYAIPTQISCRTEASPTFSDYQVPLISTCYETLSYLKWRYC